MNENRFFENDTVQNEDVMELDLLELFSVFWEKKWLLLIGCIVGALVGFFGTRYMVTPQYDATSMIYIFSKTTSLTSLANLQIGDKLAGDFTIMAKTHDVLEATIDELNLNMSYEALAGKIRVNNPDNSRIMQITVRDPDPQKAADISNMVSEKLREFIAEVMNTDEPSVVEEAVAPRHPVNSYAKRNAVLGGILVMMAIAAILTVLYVLDDTIKGEEDVEKYLRQSVLAVFPIDSTLAKGGNGKKNKSSKSKTA